MTTHHDALIDRLEALLDDRVALLACLKEFVSMYDGGTRELIGPSVKAKLARADAAISRAERTS